jgi:uncharacterized membrane protein YtjA (UPF0391 family)
VRFLVLTVVAAVIGFTSVVSASAAHVGKFLFGAFMLVFLILMIILLASFGAT